MCKSFQSFRHKYSGLDFFSVSATPLNCILIHVVKTDYLLYIIESFMWIFYLWRDRLFLYLISNICIHSLVFIFPLNIQITKLLVPEVLFTNSLTHCDKISFIISAHFQLITNRAFLIPVPL